MYSFKKMCIYIHIHTYTPHKRIPFIQKEKSRLEAIPRYLDKVSGRWCSVSLGSTSSRSTSFANWPPIQAAVRTRDQPADGNGWWEWWESYGTGNAALSLETKTSVSWGFPFHHLIDGWLIMRWGLCTPIAHWSCTTPIFHIPGPGGCSSGIDLVVSWNRGTPKLAPNHPF